MPMGYSYRASRPRAYACRAYAYRPFMRARAQASAPASSVGGPQVSCRMARFRCRLTAPKGDGAPFGSSSVAFCTALAAARSSKGRPKASRSPGTRRSRIKLDASHTLARVNNHKCGLEASEDPSR